MNKLRNWSVLLFSLAGGLALVLVMLALMGSGVSLARAGSAAPQAELHVCADGCVYTDVQSAVDAASPGDVIQIATGVYTGVTTRENMQQMVFITKSLTLRGGYNADFSAWDPQAYITTLDAQEQGRVLIISGTHTVHIEGLQLLNGRGIYQYGWGCDPFGTDPDPAGGAIYIRLATVTISATGILSSAAGTSNNEQGCGGGIYAQDAALTLVNSTIRGNVGSKDNGHFSIGGGVFLSRGSAYIAGNHFVGNADTTCYGGGAGGGLYSYNAALTLENNLFEHNNSVQDGGGGVIAGAPSTVRVSHNRIISNTAGYRGGGLVVAGGTIENNFFINNHAGSYGGALTLRPGAHRIANNVFLDNSTGYQASAVEMSRSSSASVTAHFLHNTFNHNTGENAAVLDVCSGCTAIMTNTLFTNQGVGIKNSGGTAKVTYTLWDNTITKTVGAVVATHDITGAAALAADGYHLTAASAAVDAGIETGVQDDIEGDFRPRGAAPDVGADESPYSGQAIAPGIRLEKSAAQPRWIIRPLDEGGGYLEQAYYLRFLYGPGGATPPVQAFTMTDQLPLSLTLAAESHAELVDFSQAGNTLAWQSNGPLLPGEWVWAQLHTRHTQSAGVSFRNEAEVRYQFWPTETLVLTAAAESAMPVLPPVILEPENGEACPGDITVKGMGQPGVEVTLWQNGIAMTTTTVTAGGTFSMTAYDIGAGLIATTTLTATASLNGQFSAASQPVVLTPNQAPWCPQRSVLSYMNASGHESLFRFRGPDGRISSEEWAISSRVGTYKFRLYVCDCPTTGMPPEEVRVKIGGIEFTDPDGPDGNMWEFSISGTIGRGMTSVIQCRCGSSNSDWDNRGGIISLIDPDGYVFDVAQGFDPLNPTVNTLTGVTVTAYVSMPAWGGWIPWPAHLYGQTNPQNTTPTYSDGVTTTGYFAFFTPPGYYYLQTEGRADYQTWRSPVVQVISDIVHVNVPLTPWNSGYDRRIALAPDGLNPAVVTVTAGSSVEWMATADAPMTDIVRWIENPILHLLSARNPLSDTLGFDGGMLAPGRVYRRQFTEPGLYAYTDGLGHTATVQVTAEHKIYLPLVLRNK